MTNNPDLYFCLEMEIKAFSNCEKETCPQIFIGIVIELNPFPLHERGKFSFRFEESFR